MKIFICVITIFASSCHLVAQNFIVDDSTSVYFFQGNVGSQDNSLYTTAIAGYTIDGKLDMSILGGHSKFQKVAKAFFISPTFDYLFIKQGKVPLSAGVFGSYEFKSFYESYARLRHNTGKMGINVYHEIRIGKNTSIIPSAYGTFNLVRREFPDIAKDHINYFEYGFKNSIRLKSVIINQRFSYFQNTYLVSVGIGVFLNKAIRIEPLRFE